MEKKLDITPCWTISVNKEAENTAYTDKKRFPFKLGTKIGYYTEDGVITSFIPVDRRSSVSADFWTVYDQDAAYIDFFTPDGHKSGSFDKSGFPFFDNTGIFLFHPGGSSFSKHNGSGGTEWAYENYVPITAFSSSRAGCAAGFADGNIICFNEKGQITGDFYPGGSNTQVIFGAALSQSGTYCACLSGLNPQRIVIAELAGGKTKIIYHDYLKDNLREQTLVRFSSDDKYAFFNGKSGLISVLLKEKEAFFMPFSGKVLSISEFGSKDIFFVLSKDADMYTVTILCEGKYNKGAFSFKAENAFLYAENGNIYVGCNDRISKMTLSFD